ncbi:MAG TPA: alkaline phosphatase family protein, partial [Acidisarcina sp.]
MSKLRTCREAACRVVVHRVVALLACVSLVLPAPAQGRRAPKPIETPIAYSAYNAHPKLVIIVVIDQFRGDYLDRYHADFKGRGFRLFLDHGAYFPDCYYDYANTKTAPGHSTLGTGAYTDGHGIASNEWWDLKRNKERPISSVEDERYRQVGGPVTNTASPTSTGSPTTALTSVGGYMAPTDSAIGASPRNLLASTIGDELRLATQGQSKVYGISLKDRASILPAGSAANAAFWIDQNSGYFVTSTYYTPQLPAWATAFNTSGRIEQAYKDSQPAPAAAVSAPNAKTATGRRKLSRQTAKAETEKPAIIASLPPASQQTGPGPTGKGFYGIVGSTPAANSYELDFARALIQGEQLGQHPTTDLITISLSANDIMGHQAGPDSTYERQMVDGLDTDLDSFFSWLDKSVEGGLPNVMIALSADHGIAPIPAEAAKLGIPAVSVSLGKIIASVNEAINLKFSPGEGVTYLLGHQELPYLALNAPAFEKSGINE